MTGLFYDIQSYFKATYSGRYLAFLLAELFTREPDAFVRILNGAGIPYKHKRGDKAVANRWFFTTAAGKRFADIAILNAGDHPVALIEIKDSDIKSDGNAAQLDDYLNFISRKINRSTYFLFLSRTIPGEEDAKTLNWPAPGSEDTKLGVFMGPEVSHGETKVYAGVQA